MNCIHASGIRFLQPKLRLGKYSASGNVQTDLKLVDYMKERYISMIVLEGYCL